MVCVHYDIGNLIRRPSLSVDYKMGIRDIVYIYIVERKISASILGISLFCKLIYGFNIAILSGMDSPNTHGMAGLKIDF